MVPLEKERDTALNPRENFGDVHWTKVDDMRRATTRMAGVVVFAAVAVNLHHSEGEDRKPEPKMARTVPPCVGPITG